MSTPVKFEVIYEVKCVFYETHTITEADVKDWLGQQMIYPKSNDNIEIDCDELTADEVNQFIQFLKDNYDAADQMKAEMNTDEPYYIDEPSSFGQNYSKEEEGLPQSLQDTLEKYWEKFLEEHEEEIVKRVMKEAEEKAAKELKEAEEKVEETFSIDMMTSYKTLLKEKDEIIDLKNASIKSMEEQISNLQKIVALLEKKK
jgi:hypothetical protein